MNAWPASTGEAIHTSTFLGNPIACAAAIAQLSEIEEHGLVRRAALLGSRIRTRLDPWSARYEIVRNIRGLGLLQGIVMRARVGSAPAAIAADVAHRALQSGVLALTEGSNGDVLAITPPATITEAQLDHALDVVESAIAGACRRVP
jgi:4-aminobutyrate aminotransferase-like enzyme